MDVLGSPLYSLGFEFHEPTSTSLVNGTNTVYFHDSSFTISLFSGSSFVDSVVFSPANDELVFFGFTSDVSFDSLSIIESASGLKAAEGNYDRNIDNEVYGQFYGSTSLVAAVPEPSILALMGFGLAMVFTRRRKTIA